MRKSFSKVKKYLGTPLQNTTFSNEQTTRPITISSFPNKIQRPLNIPQLVCQNQNLRDRIILLEKEKQLLQKSFKSRINQSVDSQSIYVQKKGTRSMQKQYKSPSRSFELPYSTKNPQKKSININESRISKFTQYPSAKQQYLQLLEAQQQKNRKLELKVKRLNLTIQNQQKQKQQLAKIIDQLRKKLQQSTQQILKLERLPIPEQKQANIQNSQNSNMQRQKTHNQEVNLSQFHILQQQLQEYQQKMLDYYYVKDQNYKLRDRIAQLILNNKILHQKVVFSSKAVDHLWKIKQIQIQNLTQCLKEMKEQ